MPRSFSLLGFSAASAIASATLVNLAQSRDAGRALAEPPNPPPPVQVNVGFSPGGGCTAAILKEISTARESILVQAEVLTSTPIAQKLAEKLASCHRVIVILDKAHAKKQRSLAADLANAGVAVQVDTRHNIARSNIIIIDRKVIITGGFGFTSDAENANAENLVIIRNAPNVADLYVRSFDAHLKHSAPYVARGGTLPTGNNPQKRNPTGTGAN